VTIFSTIVAGTLLGTVSIGLAVSFSFSFLSVALSFSAFIAIVGSGMGASTSSVSSGSCSSPSTTFIVSLPLIPLDKSRGGVVREGCLGGSHKFGQPKLGVFGETFVGVELDHFAESEGARDVGVRAHRVDRLVRSFSYGIQKPIDFLFFGWWVERVVVCHLDAQFSNRSMWVQILVPLTCRRLSMVWRNVR
jgi:hypothetical protein